MKIAVQKSFSGSNFVHKKTASEFLVKIEIVAKTMNFLRKKWRNGPF